MALMELIPHALPPITESDNYRFTASAIIFKNAGNTTITINSFYTMGAGETLQFSVSNEKEVIITGTWMLKFGAGTTPLLQVMMLIPRDQNFNNYVQQ